MHFLMKMLSILVWMELIGLNETHENYAFSNENVIVWTGHKMPIVVTSLALLELL